MSIRPHHRRETASGKARIAIAGREGAAGGAGVAARVAG